MKQTTRSLMLVLLLATAACRPDGPVGGSASLPPDAVQGAGEPTRAAILGSAAAFSSPANLAGRPAEAARAVAELEYLAVEIPYGPRWRGFVPTVGMALQDARADARHILGIPAEAPSQPVIDALFAASRALQAGNAAAAQAILAPPLFSAGGAATLQRLSALPWLPRAAQATARTQAEMERQDRDGRPGGGGLGIGGGVHF